MSNPNKDKGDRAEREVQDLLRHYLGIPEIRRELGAGRKDDMGDIAHVPHFAIQVADWKDIVAAMRTKLITVEQQRKNKRVRFGAVFLRRRGGAYVVCMEPQNWARLLKFAIIGIRHSASTKALNETKLTVHGNGTTGAGRTSP